MGIKNIVCKATIVPIGLNQLGKDIYIKFGLPFVVNGEKEFSESILDLRDVLATLKWDIFEYIKETRIDGFITRSELDKNYWSDYLVDRVKEWPMTDLLEEMEYVFHPKEEAYVYFEEYIGTGNILSSEKEISFRAREKTTKC